MNEARPHRRSFCEGSALDGPEPILPICRGPKQSASCAKFSAGGASRWASCRDYRRPLGWDHGRSGDNPSNQFAAKAKRNGPLLWCVIIAFTLYVIALLRLVTIEYTSSLLVTFGIVSAADFDAFVRAPLSPLISRAYAALMAVRGGHSPNSYTYKVLRHHACTCACEHACLRACIRACLRASVRV